MQTVALHVYSQLYDARGLAPHCRRQSVLIASFFNVYKCVFVACVAVGNGVGYGRQKESMSAGVGAREQRGRAKVGHNRADAVAVVRRAWCARPRLVGRSSRRHAATRQQMAGAVV